MRALLVACLLAQVLVPSWATTIVPVYGRGAFDMTPVEPLPDNPGRTLGEQRRNAHNYVVQLVERVVWLPNDKKILSDVEWIEKRLRNFIACASVISTPTMDLELGRDVDRTFALGVLRGEETPATHGDYFEVDYSSGKEFSLSLSLDPTGPTELVATGLHEHMHLLGFTSSDPTGRQFVNSDGRAYSDFDLHLRLAGQEMPVYDLSDEKVQEIASADGAAGWQGDATSAAAPRLLTSGQVNGQVLLTEDLSHVSFQVEPQSVMWPAGGRSLELGIVAYMLSDLGWGPVVDTAVTATAARQTVTASVSTTATPGDPARNLVVTTTLPDGVRVASMVETPATCSTDAGKVSCAYAEHHDSTSIQYALTGTPGVHAVEVDVDHQDYHVDPKPVNNFATVQVTVGVNTIEAVTLSRSSVAEGRPRDTEVGRLGVDSAADASVTHTFELTSDAAGGAHNACFRVDGERLLTAKPFDREGLANLNLRVLATASNGFTRAQNFTVAVTSAGSSASAWTWSTAAHADTSANSLDLRGFALAALLLFIAGHALNGSRRRRTGSRLALALTVLLLTASCGGGGGGSSSPAPPPRPAFTC